MFKLKRYSGNPILEPIKEHPWESKMVFNCATALKNGKIYLIYRARGEEKIHNVSVSRLGLAVMKKNGLEVEKRYEKPIFEPKRDYEIAGCEDPRITKIGKKYYLLYTAYFGKMAPPMYEKERTNIAIASTTDFFNWERHGLLLPSVLAPEKNGILFPKKIKGHYIVYYRIEPHIFIAFSKNLNNPKWISHKVIASPRKGTWDAFKIGAGPPPIETKDGWLFIYHGVDRVSEARRLTKTEYGTADQKRTYRLGVMLIDKHNPEKILYRSDGWILEPEKKYEKEGFIPNVVFSCGATVVKDTLFVYYGGADTVIGVATCKLSELLKAIKNKKI